MIWSISIITILSILDILNARYNYTDINPNKDELKFQKHKDIFVGSNLKRLNAYYNYSDLTESEAQEMLDRHNEIRGTIEATSMIELQWNSTLARLSAEWIEKCKFVHPDVKKNPEYAKLGENMYMVRTTSKTFQGVHTTSIDSWYNERVYFDNFHCKPDQTCQHYTQMVWAETRFVGCARHNCKNDIFVMCCYKPQGNLAGQNPYISGQPCTECNWKLYPHCNHGLCSVIHGKSVVTYISWKILSILILYHLLWTIQVINNGNPSSYLFGKIIS